MCKAQCPCEVFTCSEVNTINLLQTRNLKYIILVHNLPKPVNQHAIEFSTVNLDPNIFEPFHYTKHFEFKLRYPFQPLLLLHSNLKHIQDVKPKSLHNKPENMALIHMIWFYSFSIDYTW